MYKNYGNHATECNIAMCTYTRDQVTCVRTHRKLRTILME